MGTTSWDSCGVPIGLSKIHVRPILLFIVHSSATLTFDKSSDFIALSAFFRLLTVGIFISKKQKKHRWKLFKISAKTRLFLHLYSTITYGKRRDNIDLKRHLVPIFLYIVR